MSITKTLTRTRFGLRPALNAWRRSQARRRYKRRLTEHRSDGCLFASTAELRLLLGAEVYLNDRELPLLAKYARGAPNRIVEIGAAYGASSAVFLAHCRSAARLHSIDPFVTDSMVPFRATERQCRRNVHALLRLLGMPEKYDQWNLIPDFSYEVVKGWDAEVDVLFVDGDHQYEAVRKDLVDWLPHVRPGGFILLHDSQKSPGTPEDTFDKGWPGPTRAACELESDAAVALVETAYSVTVFQKR